MTLDEIQWAVTCGHVVHWKNTGYTVVCKDGQWYITYADGNTIGLTWSDRTTLNGEPEDFYIGG